MRRPPAPPPVETGFYGKIPTAGDFIGRGLPREVIRRWDRWMEIGLRDALAGPGGGGVWRFVTRPGVFAEVPVAGVWALSRDRVGRRFPFLVAATGTSPRAADPWFDAAAALVAAAVAGRLDAPSVAAEAAALGTPEPGPAIGEVARFWLGAAALPLCFASAVELAEDGLARLFLAGGAAAPGGTAAAAPEEDDLDALIRDGGAELHAPAAPPPEDDLLDLDDLLGEAGSGAADPADTGTSPDLEAEPSEATLPPAASGTAPPAGAVDPADLPDLPEPPDDPLEAILEASGPQDLSELSELHGYAGPQELEQDAALLPEPLPGSPGASGLAALSDLPPVPDPSHLPPADDGSSPAPWPGTVPTLGVPDLDRPAGDPVAEFLDLPDPAAPGSAALGGEALRPSAVLDLSGGDLPPQPRAPDDDQDDDAQPAGEIADEDDLVDLDELFDLGGSGSRGGGSPA